MKVLKFGAEWCPGCIIMKPRWKEIEDELGWLKNEFYDYDKDKEMVEKYKITQTLPTFVFIDKDGNEITRLSGEYEKNDLIQLVNKYKDN
ncbi:MAG: thioredoxin family protein [Candidatus Paceibacterota bacterium]|jgi:thiol-disulfide isomerase/thioredoxin